MLLSSVCVLAVHPCLWSELHDSLVLPVNLLRWEGIVYGFVGTYCCKKDGWWVLGMEQWRCSQDCSVSAVKVYLGSGEWFVLVFRM